MVNQKRRKLETPYLPTNSTYSFQDSLMNFSMCNTSFPLLFFCGRLRPSAAVQVLSLLNCLEYTPEKKNALAESAFQSSQILRKGLEGQEPPRKTAGSRVSKGREGVRYHQIQSQCGLQQLSTAVPDPHYINSPPAQQRRLIEST